MTTPGHQEHLPANPELAVFDPLHYIEEARTILNPITTEHGISFSRYGNDQYRTELSGLYPEHVAAEELAWEQMSALHPDKSTKQKDSAAQLIGHISRASAVLQKQRGESFVRFGQLPAEDQKAVIEEVVQSGRGEPNWHVNLGQTPIREIIDLSPDSIREK